MYFFVLMSKVKLIKLFTQKEKNHAMDHSFPRSR